MNIIWEYKNENESIAYEGTNLLGGLEGKEVFIKNYEQKNKLQITAAYDEAVSSYLINIIEATKVLLSKTESLLIFILHTVEHPVTLKKYYSVHIVSNINNFDPEKNLSIHWFRSKKAANYFMLNTETFISEQRVFTTAELGREFGVERQNVSVSLIRNTPQFQPVFRSVKNTPFWDFTSYHSILESEVKAKIEGIE